MPVITKHVEIAAPASATFDYLSSYENVPDWMFGVTSFVPVGPVSRGTGDRFDAEMKLGPKSLHSTVDIVEWVDGSVIALSSVKGFETSSRWVVTPVDDGHCVADVEFRYEFPGGFTGKALAKVVEPFINQGISVTDRTLRSRLESPRST
ncbi:SRPBCC family protein [Rhodococcus sp. BP-349]|uniref:SRPBCC family protein n=1 Tax=unclassified Rhodococcus (in: high G+C Gram-positive bacteria) TaxID=192944 RepID=UPI001C9B3CA6|nr:MULTISPECIES: SRPBCC family protein [unclassified Rhodococcus (in: high G+C Gram-positive bacteria)]MBY6540126.1 SRPBCC family protein [Rhodococcus sp. BP-363]MBY6543546.1 SRPBCC family protein [Rhodococcus sp. BP-369]MBY6562776.1 SRPBCC family protein [Rhodococcus sp. BP-370]MBY6577068.1 SRPBCC family protein [Rhodococcus sp. BP-364]MBY6586369.1 SRPBCC family protein [Rhodococcus sp. BP-358]